MVYGRPDFEIASDFARALHDDPKPSWQLFRHRWRDALRTAWFVARRPTVTVLVSSSPAGRMLKRSARARRNGLPVGRVARAVQILPASEAAYLRGRSRQALRTNIRRARELGVSCREVTRDEAIAAVSRIAAQREQATGDRFETDAWWGTQGRRYFVARDVDDTPVVLAVVVVDVEAAFLECFVSSRSGEAAQRGRYLLHSQLAVALGQNGVRHLLVDSGLRLSPGLQYFQHLLGFRCCNLRIGPATVHPSQGLARFEPANRRLQPVT